MIGTIYVYSYPLYQKEKGWYKIGKTIQTGKARVRQQTTGMPEGANKHFEFQIECEKESEIYALENSIQTRFKLRDKWVQEGGGTEWFGPTTLDEILEVCTEEIEKLDNKELTKTYLDYTPRKCQIEGEPKVREGLKKYNKGRVVAATGTGKTILCYSIVRNTNKTVLFLAPTISLVEQSYKEWSKFEPLNSLLVCSAKDLEDDDTLITTNPNSIESFLSCTMDSRLNVIFGTYHSAEQIAIAQAKAGVDFDIAFYDEAHQTVTHVDGRNYQSVLDSFIKADKKVFVTATPKVVNHSRGVNVASMNDESIYGPLFYELTTREAIDKGWSVDFETYYIEISQCRYNQVAEEILNNSIVSYSDELMKARHISSLACILKTIELGSKKIATFHTFNTSAVKFAELIKELRNSGDIAEDILIKDLSTTNNPDSSLRFRFLAEDFCNAETAIITSAKWMREGVDIPCLDTIVLVDPIGTGIACQQTIGRALRVDPNNPNKIAKIIIPAFLGDGHDTSRDVTALTVLANMHNVEEGTEFEFNVTNPNATRTMSNTTFNVVEDREIPDARRVEMNEYYESIGLRSLGLYNGDKGKTENLLFIIENLFKSYISDKGIKYPYLKHKKVTDKQVKDFVKNLDKDLMVKIWTRHAKNKSNFIYNYLRWGGSYGRLKENGNQFSKHFCSGLKVEISKAFINTIFDHNLILGGRSKTEIITNQLNKELKPFDLKLSNSLIYQQLKNKVLNEGSDKQKLLSFQMASNPESFYNLLIKPIVKNSIVEREDFKKLVYSTFDEETTKSFTKFNRLFKSICEDKKLEIITLDWNALMKQRKLQNNCL